MKKSNLLIAIVLIINCQLLFTNCSAQSWLWAKSAYGTTRGESFHVSSDASGNVFVTGGFSSPTITFGTTTLTNADPTGSTEDVFVAKYDANGNVLWAKSAGGISDDQGYSVSADAFGNVFVTGYFFSPAITFGTGPPLLNAGSMDVFIAKYDANGNVLWAKSAGGIFMDQGYSVSADAGGNVLVTGEFTGPTIVFGTTTLINAGSIISWADVFVVKYDPNGNVLWAKSAGGTNDDQGYSVSADAVGNAFVTGYFYSSTINFGTTTLPNTSVGFKDLFIAKYDVNGNLLWTKSVGGTKGDVGHSVSADAGGNVFITGEFYSPTITFGTTTLINADPSGNTQDIFIAKYDAGGNVLLAQRAGGTYDDAGYSLCVDFASGNMFVTGLFNSSTIIFGSTSLTYASVGVKDIFIVKYDPSGNVLCASALANGSDGYFNNSVSADPFGNAYLGGKFSANPFIVGSSTLTNTGGNDFFVAKYTCGSTGIANYDLQDAINIYPNPGNGMFNVQGLQVSAPSGMANANASIIEIYNVMGEKVYGQAISEPRSGNSGSSPNGLSLITVNLSDAPNGIYFIQFKTHEGVAVKKIIISH